MRMRILRVAVEYRSAVGREKKEGGGVTPWREPEGREDNVTTDQGVFEPG